MRLNALHPSDNPMEELLFCFGGGDDDGDSGGGSSHPGRPGGESGERGNRSDRSDRSDRGDRDDDPMGMADLAAAAEAATGGRTDTAAAEAAIDAMDRDGRDDDDSGPSLIDNYLDGPMMADISTPMVGGAFVDSLGRGIMADIPGAAAQSAMDYTNAIATGQRGSGNTAMTTGDLDTGTGGARFAGVGFDDPLKEGVDFQVASPTSIAPSPYEQLIGAPEFQTSMGAPPESTEFGAVDIPFVPKSIDVFGIEVPTGLGVVEGVLNAIFDPTGTTQQAVYDRGVRSINGQPTGNESGLDILTEEGSVIGAYDPDANIVYATEGNRFNPALDSYYETKRARDEEERDESNDVIVVDPTDIQEEDVAVDNDAEYEGQPIGGLFPTSTLPDLNRDLTQYTDVGNIQPFVLRPYGMKKGGIVDAARFKNGGMVQRYQDGGSVDAATQRLADLTYQMMTSGIIKDQGLDPEIKTPRFSSSKERNEFLRQAGYNPGDLQNFYGSNAGPQNEISKALYERYTGSDRPAGRSNIADLAYLQSQGFDVSKNMDMYDPKTRQVFDMAVQNPRSGYDLSRQYATTGEVPTQFTGIEALQNQFNTLQQQYNDLLARFEDEQRQQSLMSGMGSGTFGESSAGYTGTGINMGTGSGTFAQTTPTYTQLDPLAGLGSGFMGNMQPSFLMPQTPETNFLADPFSTATNVGYVPPPVYYPFAYQVPGQQQ